MRRRSSGRCEPIELDVEVMEFEAADAAMRGGMMVTFVLIDAGVGTDVLAVHDNLPLDLSPADNETGWRMAFGETGRYRNDVVHEAYRGSVADSDDPPWYC